MRKIIMSAAIFVLLLFATMGVSYAAEDHSSAQSVSSISLLSYPSKTVYGAFEQFDKTGLSLYAVYSDGSRRVISGQDIRISYNRDNCFRVGDESVMLSYGGKSLYLPVTVNRISYDISSMELDGFSTVYNGNFQSYNRYLPQIVGLDGIPLTVNASGGGINAGVYDISIDFSTESTDYLTPESRVVPMTIEPANAEIVWEGLSFVYDGKSKTPTAYYIDVNGAKVYPSVSGGATNAGTGYVARVSLGDSNYNFSSASVNYEIKKADYDFSGVSWSRDSFTYDGSTKSITALGLPSGVSIIGYSGDRADEAGTYTAIANLRWDENNYNSPPPLTHRWEIKKADYNMAGVSFRNESFVFDGRMHYPSLVGTMPIGADGIQLEYSFSAGACHVADGTVSVVISFHTDSKNYNLPKDAYSSVSITPRGINVNWGDNNLTYSGEEQAPIAYADECSVTVSGTAVNVGKYIATAATENSDYYINNSRIEYSIIKAENFWTVQPADSVCYEGKKIYLTGESRFGEITVRYFSDRECRNEIKSPSACGQYYAILAVSETENFGALISNVISFEIVEIVEVSFVATLLKENIKAFEKLDHTDFTCSVMYNDGSCGTVYPSLVSIIYQQSDSFRKSDEWVKLGYGDFILTLPVSVDYADYDLSGVTWLNTVQTYNGSPLLPKIDGLPSGVTVAEYLGMDNINAGSYTVNVRLDYDRENYNEPLLSPCEFTIEKCPISVPLFESVYNGEGQLPISDSPLYTVTSGEEYINSGIYTVGVRLSDPDNYVFKENYGKEANAIFEIAPATLWVRVNDTRLRLFEKVGDVDFTISLGVIYGDDILSVSAFKEGKYVNIRSENPNYKLIVERGKIIRLPYPTWGGAFILALIILSFVLLVWMIHAIYQNRHRIVSGAAMAKCRWVNRGYKAPPPREDITSPIKYEPQMPPAEYDDIEEDNSCEIAEESEASIADGVNGDAEIDRIAFEVDIEKADSLITDSLAKNLIKREGEMVCTDGSGKATVDVGALNKAFNAGERVDVNSLKEKGLISSDVAFVKIIGGGVINKPLSVFANDFSLSAVKMIVLSGGDATKIFTFKGRS